MVRVVLLIANEDLSGIRHEAGDEGAGSDNEGAGQRDQMAAGGRYLGSDPTDHPQKAGGLRPGRRLIT